MMSRNELSKALLRGEDPIDLAQLTEQVLRRDRRRIRWLGIVCVCAWMLVVALPWSTVLPMLGKAAEHQQKLAQGPALTPAEQQDQALKLAQASKIGIIATFIGSMSTMFVAAICTVSFIIVSRRATLRQVNARLAEISAQLKAMGSGMK
jgi:hypothetical protein